MSPELTVVVPTLDERDNIEVLVERIARVLEGVAWEVIFVDDDSRDGTLEVLHRLARRDARIRYIHRIGRSGLSSACLEGMASSSAPYLAVMDADLQHDEELLPQMLELLRRGDTDLVVGSRYVEGGEDRGLSNTRLKLSRMAAWLGRLVLRVPLHDSMSGFFMLTRELYLRSARRVSGKGFKILLDIVASVPELVRIKEIPYVFRERHAGESKLDTLVVYEFILVLADKLVGRYIPVQFLIFSLVGFLGALLHLSVLGTLLNFAGLEFVYAQLAATVFAMTVNFTVNNLFTFRVRRLRGSGFARGLLFFYGVCGVGAFVNIRVAVYLFGLGVPWWGAGLIGMIIGAVWNFSVATIVVWQREHRGRLAKAEPVGHESEGPVVPAKPNEKP